MFQVAYMMLAGSAFELFDCAKNVDGFYYLNSVGWCRLTPG
jgi:hypothetical protein